MDLPTYLSSIGSLATCLVRLVLGRTLFGFADIFVFNWIFSDVFGSLGSQGEHCLDLPTYLSSIGPLASCLVRSVLRENTGFADIFVFNWILSDVLVRAGLVSGLLFFEFEICLFGRLATCLDHLGRSLIWEKNATPCELFFITCIKS